MSGIVYFIQPSEFISSDIYKIGYSKQPLLNRIKQYGSKTSIKCVFESSNVIKTEKNLISKFNENFVKFKGNEYFICKDVPKAKTIFYEVCNSHYVTNDDSSSIMDADIDTDIDANLETKEINKFQVEKQFQCEICKYFTTRKSNFKTHMTSKKHANNIIKNKSITKYECKLCNYKTDCLAHYNQHLESRKHKNIKKETKEDCGSKSEEEKEVNEITTKEIKEGFCMMQGMFCELIKSNQQLATIIKMELIM